MQADWICEKAWCPTKRISEGRSRMLDLPQLHSIELDYCALRGDERDEQEALEEKPYNYKNTLIMKNLPSLTSFKSYRCNCQFIGSVTVENIMAWNSYRQ
ncbi:hypothetical protein WA538_003372 [Blastocystis sp. DL]